MSRAVRIEDDLSIPRPPGLRPTWTTWAYIAFMIAVVVFTAIGLQSNVFR
ncbi:MAG TPA: hypothetical protein VF881_17445 [Polyangiaceae bacterium]